MKKNLSEIEKRRIIQILNERIPNLECPMCHEKHFIIADGYFNSIIQAELNDIMIGGPSIPNIGIVCGNCGFISHHALGVLGLLPQKNETESNQK